MIVSNAPMLPMTNAALPAIWSIVKSCSVPMAIGVSIIGA